MCTTSFSIGVELNYHVVQLANGSNISRDNAMQKAGKIRKMSLICRFYYSVNLQIYVINMNSVHQIYHTKCRLGLVFS